MYFMYNNCIRCITLYGVYGVWNTLIIRENKNTQKCWCWQKIGHDSSIRGIRYHFSISLIMIDANLLFCKLFKLRNVVCVCVCCVFHHSCYCRTSGMNSSVRAELKWFFFHRLSFKYSKKIWFGIESQLSMLQTNLKGKISSQHSFRVFHMHDWDHQRLSIGLLWMKLEHMRHDSSQNGIHGGKEGKKRKTKRDRGVCEKGRGRGDQRGLQQPATIWKTTVFYTLNA